MEISTYFFLFIKKLNQGVKICMQNMRWTRSTLPDEKRNK